MAKELTQEWYRFVKVPEFFQDLNEWDALGSVIAHSHEEEHKRLALSFDRADSGTCVLLMSFLRKETLRVRFYPTRTAASDYSDGNTRSTVMDTMTELTATFSAFDVSFQSFDDRLEMLTSEGDEPYMKVVVRLAPFGIDVYRITQLGEFLVSRDAGPAIRYRKVMTKPDNDVLDTDYSIVANRETLHDTLRTGFGEKGGSTLSKNGTQLTYFNYDNMRYRQVNNRGAKDPSEPLYHTNLFFLEMNVAADIDTLCGVFLDNPSELFADVGFTDPRRCSFGAMYGELDYYLFVVDDVTTLIDAYTSLVGHARLKPRYALGYHQGCYGYTTADSVLGVSRAYRANTFPIDGMHIDVDIQDRLRTFTAGGSFGDPKPMFDELKGIGIKCSTNITPVISLENGGYPTYFEGLEKGYFVADERIPATPGTTERHENYNGGVRDPKWFPNENYNSGNPYKGEVFYGFDKTEGHYPDLGRSVVRRWWGSQYQHLFDLGLEMVWQDMTTPAIPRLQWGDMKSFPYDLGVTNNFRRKYDGEVKLTAEEGEEIPYAKGPAIKLRALYAYNLHKATYHGLNHLNGRENKRNFIVGRGSFSGMHRFAALWTGDNASTWDFLQINVAQVLALGLSGQPVSGADIGGFEPIGGEHWCPSPELFIRWIQAGCFLPWFRNHYKGIAKGGKEWQEPFNFERRIAEVTEEDKWIYRAVLPITRHYVELRYRLMQLLYDGLFQNTLTGLPITRALFVNFPKDKTLYGRHRAFLDNEFFVGDHLLVAPVLESDSINGGSRDVYLPAGSSWYAFMDNALPLASAIPGGTTVTYDAYISTEPGHLRFMLPMYVRSGAVIPTIPVEKYTGELHARGLERPITLNIYPGASGAHDMYLDDGESRSSAISRPPEQGGDPVAADEYRQVRVSYQMEAGQRKRVIRIQRLHDGFTPRESYFTIALLHDPGEFIGDERPQNGPLSSVSIGDTALPSLNRAAGIRRASELASSDANAWYYDAATNISYIKVFDVDADITVTADYRSPTD